MLGVRIRETLARAAIVMQREIKQQLNKGASNRGRTPSRPGSPPHKDTGTLSRAIQIDSSRLQDPEAPEVRIGPDITFAPYARIHELGGVIRPKKGKFLVFPAPDDPDRLIFARQVVMPARPYIRPALKLARPKIRKLFSEIRR